MNTFCEPPQFPFQEKINLEPKGLPPSDFDLLFRDIKTDWVQHFAPTFSEGGQPAHSCISIALNFFFHAAFHYFKKDVSKAKQFMNAHLFDVLMFSETIRERIGLGEGGVISDWRLEMTARMVEAWVKNKAEGKPTEPKKDTRSRWRKFLDWVFRKKSV